MLMAIAALVPISVSLTRLNAKPGKIDQKTFNEADPKGAMLASCLLLGVVIIISLCGFCVAQGQRPESIRTNGASSSNDPILPTHTRQRRTTLVQSQADGGPFVPVTPVLARPHTTARRQSRMTPVQYVEHVIETENWTQVRVRSQSSSTMPPPRTAQTVTDGPHQNEDIISPEPDNNEMSVPTIPPPAYTPYI